MLLGAGGGQAIAILAVPLISRLYSPEDYGYLTLVLSITGIFSSVVTLRFESAAMLPRSIAQARPLAWNAVLSSLFLSTLLGVVVGLLSHYDVGKLGDFPGIGFWVGITTLLTALFSVVSQLALREKDYGLVARRTFLQAWIGRLTQIFLGFTQIGATGLLIGNALGKGAGLFTVWRRVKDYFAPVPTYALQAAFRKYWRFPTIFTLSTLLNFLVVQSPGTYFNIVFGPSVGGQVGMASTLVAVPLILIGYVVGQLAEAEFSDTIRLNNPGLRQMYVRFSLWLSILGAVSAAFFGLFGATVIPWFLGEEWLQAAAAAQVMAITLLPRVIAAPTGRVIVLLEKSRAALTLDLLRVLVMASGYAWALHHSLGVEATLWVVYGGLAITYLMTWCLGFVLTGHYDGNTMRAEGVV